MKRRGFVAGASAASVAAIVPSVSSGQGGVVTSARSPRAGELDFGFWLPTLFGAIWIGGKVVVDPVSGEVKAVEASPPDFQRWPR